MNIPGYTSTALIGMNEEVVKTQNATLLPGEVRRLIEDLEAWLAWLDTIKEAAEKPLDVSSSVAEIVARINLLQGRLDAAL